MNVVEVLNSMGDQLSTYEGGFFTGEYLFGDITDLHFKWKIKYQGLYGLNLDNDINLARARKVETVKYVKVVE